jgi:hypothetical protein
MTPATDTRVIRSVSQPARYFRTEGELCLSKAGHLELLRGVIDRRVAFRMGVRGSSMAPLIRDGDVLTIMPLHDHVPMVGDVVAFATSRGDLCIHRIIAPAPAGWLTRGDGCPEPDEVVPRENVLGRVARVECDGRTARLGMGPERRLVAWLSARNWLLPFKMLCQLRLRALGALLRSLQRRLLVLR